jgi:hypothetical protein
MFKMINILQSRIKEISKAMNDLLIFAQGQQRNTSENAITAKNKHIIGKGHNIIATYEPIIRKDHNIIATRKPSSLKRKPSSLKRKTSSLKRKTSSITRKSSSLKRKTSSLKRKTSSLKRKSSSVTINASSDKIKSSSFKSKASSVKRKRSSVKNHGIFRTNILSPELNEFIVTADEYLHYANGMLFFICNTSSIVSFIVMRPNNDRRIPGSSILIIIFHLNKSKPVYFIIRAENANVFEGVIERYCGVPP